MRMSQVAMNLGALGFSTWNVGLSLAGLFSAFFLPHFRYMTFNPPWNAQPAYPLGLNVRRCTCCDPAYCRYSHGAR